MDLFKILIELLMLLSVLFPSGSGLSSDPSEMVTALGGVLEGYGSLLPWEGSWGKTSNFLNDRMDQFMAGYHAKFLSDIDKERFESFRTSNYEAWRNATIRFYSRIQELYTTVSGMGIPRISRNPIKDIDEVYASFAEAYRLWERTYAFFPKAADTLDVILTDFLELNPDHMDSDLAKEIYRSRYKLYRAMGKASSMKPPIRSSYPTSDGEPRNSNDRLQDVSEIFDVMGQIAEVLGDLGEQIILSTGKFYNVASDCLFWYHSRASIDAKTRLEDAKEKFKEGREELIKVLNEKDGLNDEEMRTAPKRIPTESVEIMLKLLNLGYKSITKLYLWRAEFPAHLSDTVQNFGTIKKGYLRDLTRKPEHKAFIRSIKENRRWLSHALARDVIHSRTPDGDLMRTKFRTSDDDKQHDVSEDSKEAVSDD